MKTQKNSERLLGKALLCEQRGFLYDRDIFLALAARAEVRELWERRRVILFQAVKGIT